MVVHILSVNLYIHDEIFRSDEIVKHINSCVERCNSGSVVRVFWVCGSLSTLRLYMKAVCEDTRRNRTPFHMYEVTRFLGLFILISCVIRKPVIKKILIRNP